MMPEDYQQARVRTDQRHFQRLGVENQRVVRLVHRYGHPEVSRELGAARVMSQLDPDRPHTSSREGADPMHEPGYGKVRELPAGQSGWIDDREQEPRLSVLLAQLGHDPLGKDREIAAEIAKGVAKVVRVQDDVGEQAGLGWLERC